MTQRTIELTVGQRLELEALRDRGAKAYQRERAAAILKVAGGQPAAGVARNGLLRRRKADTVYAWLNRFEAEGIAGLLIRAGRGRKPAFSPSAGNSGGSEGGHLERGAAGAGGVRP